MFKLAFVMGVLLKITVATIELLVLISNSIELCYCRTSLAFRLMPQGNAILDCSPIAAAGHVIPQSYVPISVSQFMDDLSAEEEGLCNRADHTYVSSIFE